MTILGSSHGRINYKKNYPYLLSLNCVSKIIGFDPCGHTTGFVLWCNGSGIMVDPPPFSNSYLKSMGINPAKISAIIITHCHADHDAGAIEKILFEKKIEVTFIFLTYPTHKYISRHDSKSDSRLNVLINLFLCRLSQQERL